MLEILYCLCEGSQDLPERFHNKSSMIMKILEQSKAEAWGKDCGSFFIFWIRVKLYDVERLVMAFEI
jgi:hypothetical protein